MSLAPPAAASVNLDNCDREPIHIPGRVQAHGALLGFGADGVLRWASANASAVLGVGLPALGERLSPTHFDGDAAVAVTLAAEMQAGPQGAATTPRQHEVQLGGRVFDLLVHQSDAFVVAEFEPRAPEASDPAAFAIRAHRGLDALRRGRLVQELLETAVREIRALTGFDRVMAYRFRHDASGDVVAEERDESLEPFLNRRYPASDIPAQARRLYVVNTLRLISDVRSAAVPLEGPPGPPLDLSHSVLRSVSPVHIEYLGNLGVGASMSVSIVIGGQLWGMLACHHMTPRVVPYAVRMACDVMAQVLAANVQTLLLAEQAQRLAGAASLRSRLVEQLLVGEDPLGSLSPSLGELATVLEAEGVVLAESGRLSLHGGVPEEGARALLAWLDGPGAPVEAGLLALHAQSALPPPVADALGNWCGVLALRHDEVGPGWVLLLRREQIETIAWGGRPEKVYANGPLGPRLTPRGSFDVWRETVRGTAVPWSPTDLEIARQLLDELGRATAARQAELVRARNQMLAVLGHDLRNPLQTISMTGQLLGRGADTARMGERLRSATSLMQNLIGQVLDMSRLQSGLGLGFSFQPVQLPAFVAALVEDVLVAFPDTTIARELPPSLTVVADPDRLAQLLGNLLSNARHHGEPGTTVKVQLRQEGDAALLSVRNQAPEIPAAVAAQLFMPFKRQSLNNERNRGGLGLGLYIASEIARGHGGTLEYAYEAPEVVFTARLPLAGP